MGRRGPQPKNPAERLRRNVDRTLKVIDGEAMDPPPAPKAWLKQTTEAWDAFWESPVSSAVREKDLDALLRLFWMRNQYERLRRMAHKNPLVEGSQGQPIQNPAHRMAKDLMGEIRQLEREFGLTPDAGARLVQTASTAQKSVDDLMSAALDDFQIVDV